MSEPKRYKFPEHKLLAVVALKGRPYNPQRRVEATKLKKLAESMSRIGLICPIIVDGKNVVIEGHRRLAAAKLLGWEVIQAQVITGINPNIIYADLNSTSSRISGNDALTVWLEVPEAVSDRQAAKFKEMAETLGLSLVRRIQAEGYSAWIYNVAIRIAQYLSTKDEDVIKSIVKWLLDLRMVSIVRKSMEVQTPPRIIFDAIKRMRPIKLAGTIVEESK